MRIFSKFLILLLALTFCFLPMKNLFAGFPVPYTFPDTDAQNDFDENTQAIFYFFDLRDRETFIQLTFPDIDSEGDNARAHVQIFDVSNNCSENNFFDIYTPNDTHIYNLRDIQTNDGNPSGVVLPDNSYGIVAITLFAIDSGQADNAGYPMGNMRIIDNNGYEYRTNGQVPADDSFDEDPDNSQLFFSFNFNQQGGVSLSDIVGITLWPFRVIQFGGESLEWNANPILGTFSKFDIDIVDNNETLFSCRDITFSCVNENTTLLEDLLSISLSNVASFEYGINNSIPHTKGGELLCPGNTVGEGTVILSAEPFPDTDEIGDIYDIILNMDANSGLPFFFGFVALNNGNSRGSLDSFWIFNACTQLGFCPEGDV